MRNFTISDLRPQRALLRRWGRGTRVRVPLRKESAHEEVLETAVKRNQKNKRVQFPSVDLK